MVKKTTLKEVGIRKRNIEDALNSYFRGDLKKRKLKIESWDIRERELGFGGNSRFFELELRTVPEDVQLPESFLLKKRIGDNDEVTKAYRREKALYILSENYLRYKKDGKIVKVFPSFYNPIGKKAPGVFDRNKILFLEFYREDKSILSKIKELESIIDRNREDGELERKIVDELIKQSPSPENEEEEILRQAREMLGKRVLIAEEKIKEILKESFNSIALFHVKSKQYMRVAENLGIPVAGLNSDFRRYTRKLNIVLEDLTKGDQKYIPLETRKNVCELYVSLWRYLSDKERLTRNIMGVVHRDTHLRNIIDSENKSGDEYRMKLVDPENSEISLIFLDIAPPLFNIHVKRPIEFLEEIVMHYLDKKNKIERENEIAVLEIDPRFLLGLTYLAGHQTCIRYAAATVNRKRNIPSYIEISSREPEYIEEIKLNVLESMRLIKIMVDKPNNYMFSQELVDSLGKVYEDFRKLGFDTI